MSSIFWHGSCYGIMKISYVKYFLARFLLTNLLRMILIFIIIFVLRMILIFIIIWVLRMILIFIIIWVLRMILIINKIVLKSKAF